MQLYFAYLMIGKYIRKTGSDDGFSGDINAGKENHECNVYVDKMFLMDSSSNQDYGL